MPNDLTEILCDYCEGPTTRLDGAALYGRADLAGRWFYRCAPCDAHVGCHPGTMRPLGTLANPATRRSRAMAHSQFDPLWKAKIIRDGTTRKQARRTAYAWLADQLGIPFDDCHIALFDSAMCRRVIDICAPYTQMLRSNGLHGDTHHEQNDTMP